LLRMHLVKNEYELGKGRRVAADTLRGLEGDRNTVNGFRRVFTTEKYGIKTGRSQCLKHYSGWLQRIVIKNACRAWLGFERKV